MTILKMFQKVLGITVLGITMVVAVPNSAHALTKTVLPPNYEVISAWFNDERCHDIVVFAKVKNTNIYHLIRYARYSRGGQYVEDDAMIVEQ